jgi:glycosyltransferase involved in cell wall biosynthesis
VSHGAPLISLIVAVRDARVTLERLLLSYEAQTLEAKQLLVVDGGSTDGTLAVLEKHARLIDWSISEPDDGVYSAWNKAIPRARGEWLCFLGADDFFWSPSSLRSLAAVAAEAYPQHRLVYGQSMMVEGDAVVGSWRKGWSECRRAFLDGVQCIPHPGMLHHASLFGNGLFDASFRIAGDYEFLLRELRMGSALYTPDVVVAGISRGGLSQHVRARLDSLKETRRARAMHGIDHRPWLWYRAWAMTLVTGLVHRSVGPRAMAGGRKLRGIWIGRGRLPRATTRPPG